MVIGLQADIGSMKASELRIGNYILFSEDNTIFEVGSIEEKGYTN